MLFSGPRLVLSMAGTIYVLLIYLQTNYPAFLNNFIQDNTHFFEQLNDSPILSSTGTKVLNSSYCILCWIPGLDLPFQDYWDLHQLKHWYRSEWNHAGCGGILLGKTIVQLYHRLQNMLQWHSCIGRVAFDRMGLPMLSFKLLWKRLDEEVTIMQILQTAMLNLDGNFPHCRCRRSEDCLKTAIGAETGGGGGHAVAGTQSSDSVGLLFQQLHWC